MQAHSAAIFGVGAIYISDQEKKKHYDIMQRY